MLQRKDMKSKNNVCIHMTALTGGSVCASHLLSLPFKCKHSLRVLLQAKMRKKFQGQATEHKL